LGGERILQQDAHRVVTLEEDGLTVRKTYRGGDPVALLALAQREYERLDRFSRALASVPGATCPAPLQVADGSHPSIRMRRASGERLSDRLRRRADEPADLTRLADVLAASLVVYVSTFGEPYYDFHFRNMLYDPSAGEVTFLDFAVPEHLVAARERLDRLSPVEVSLGNLMGSSLFESIRPRHVLRPVAGRRTLELAARVIEVVVRSAGDLRPTAGGVKEAMSIVFLESVMWGPPSHRLWYRPFRPLLVRAQPVVDTAFARARAGA
jgi:hypothetical protein